MGIPAVLVDEKGAPITHPVSDAEILAHLDRHSKAVMRPLYKTAEFCAACHKAAIPASLDEYKWLRAFTVYDEWQGASFTKQSPLPFYRKDVVSTCQTCHMQREPLAAGAEDPGAKDGKLTSHRWLGGNSLIPAYYKFDEQAEKLDAFLKHGPDNNGVLNVDIFAIERRNLLRPTRLSSRLSACAISLSPPARRSSRTSSSRTRASRTRWYPNSVTSTRRGSTSASKTPKARRFQRAVSFSPTAISIPRRILLPIASSTSRANSTISTRSGITASWPTTTCFSRAARSLRATGSACRKAIRAIHPHRHGEVPPLQPALRGLRHGSEALPDACDRHGFADAHIDCRRESARRSRP